MKEHKFELGQTVKEVVTGFFGVTMARTQHLTGCDTYGLLSRELKDGKPADYVWFDETRLEVSGEKVVLPGMVKERPGGPQPFPPQNRPHNDKY